MNFGMTKNFSQDARAAKFPKSPVFCGFAVKNVFILTNKEK
jgi:hypothetical protein